MPLPFHPYAELFPLIEGPEFAELVADIKANDLRERIVVLDGTVLDGRNRYRAALAAGLLDDDDGPDRAKYFVRFVPSVDGDPLEYVFSKNLHRRHLTTGQRAYVMAEYETLRHGGPRARSEQDANLRLDIPMAESPAEPSRADLAERGHISERSIASAAVVRDHGTQELKTAVKQAALPISVAEKIARLPETEQPAEIAKHLPNGARSIMGSRQEPDDSLDYSPTPPWGTRALVEHVLPIIGAGVKCNVWEPACGEGHIAEVLAEYGAEVFASDIHDYGYGEALIDFLSDEPCGVDPMPEWIITNPPFKEAERFTLRAIERASIGVAMFVRWQWIESIGRYERLFKPFPPTVVAIFSERIPLHMGRWEPDGATATAYCWVVWFKKSPAWGTGLPTFLHWIPPGQRTALSMSDDAERFTAHPVIKRSRTEAPPSLVEPAESVPSSPEAVGSPNVSEEVQ